MAIITLEQGDFGWDYIIRDIESGETVLIQTDYDYPGVAETFGWSLRDVQHDDNELPCRHQHTDGTIDCPNCGIRAGAFIHSAQEYLDDHIGDEAEDPGYFGGIRIPSYPNYNASLNYLSTQSRRSNAAFNPPFNHCVSRATSLATNKPKRHSILYSARRNNDYSSS
jgi:hypothetical protein